MIWAIVTAVFVALLLVAEWKESVRGKWLTKPIASLGFIAASLAHGSPLFVTIALVLSAIGDVLLIPKSTFLLGVGAFLFAHVAYAIAFWKVGIAIVPAVLAAAPIAIVAIVIARMLMPKVEREMKIPIGVYVVVVSAMFALAVGTKQTIVALGAGMFWLSDLSVARDKFLKPGFVNRLWGLPLYYAAQIVFALGT